MSNAKPTNPRIAQAFKDALDAQHIGVEKAAQALGVTKQAVSRYQNGIDDPGKEKVAAWIESDVPWVRQLGLAIFGAEFGALIQNVLVPSNGKSLAGQKSGCD